MIRSVLAVLAGYLVNIVGVSTFFALVLALGLPRMPAKPDPATFHPPAWFYAAELVSTPIIALGGGYICAWLARKKEVAHGLALGGLMLVLGIVSIVVEIGMKPLWSSAGVVVLGILGVLGGARLRGARRRAAGA
jgi:hypothetical protein